MSLEAITRYGVPYRTDNADGQRYFADVRTLAVGYAHKRDAAREDSRLTDQGRRERVAQIGREALAELEALKSAHESVGARLQELRGRAAIHEPKQPEDPRAELQAREIRDHLRSLSTTDRQTAIAKIVEGGNELGFSAVLTDPLREISPLLSDELSQRYRSAWVAARDPKLAEATGLVAELLEQMESIDSSIRKGIEADAQIAPDLRQRIGAA